MMREGHRTGANKAPAFLLLKQISTLYFCFFRSGSVWSKYAATRDRSRGHVTSGLQHDAQAQAFVLRRAENDERHPVFAAARLSAGFGRRVSGADQARCDDERLAGA